MRTSIILILSGEPECHLLLVDAKHHLNAIKERARITYGRKRDHQYEQSIKEYQVWR